jgi:CheY-like chemotaxis protein
MLIPRHRALLIFIDRQLRETGRPPSLMEMREAVKARSVATVYQAIAALEKQGFIARRRGRPRDIQVLRLPEDGHDTPAGVHGDFIVHLSHPSDVLASGALLTAQLQPGGRVGMAAGSPERASRDVQAGIASPGAREPGDRTDRQALRMTTNLAVITRARELVGSVVWLKLSPHTQANILRSEQQAMEFERDTWRTVKRSTSRPSPALGPRTADTPPGDDRTEAGPPMRTPREAEAGATAGGTPPPEVLPSLQTLQVATEAIRRGYGLTEPTRNPEIVAQAIELSFLLAAYRLVPATPEIVAVRPDTARKLSREPDGPGAAGERILVVDDVSDVLVSVTAFLVSAGFAVTTAADGDTALRLIAGDPLIGVLVTDFIMPGMSGVDLINQASQLRPDLKALLITGFPNADGLAELPSRVVVLAKPFRRAALVEQIRILVDDTPPEHSGDVTEDAHVID